MEDDPIEESVEGPIGVDNTPPDQIIAEQETLVSSAIDKLVRLGLTQAEAQAIAGSSFTG